MRTLPVGFDTELQKVYTQCTWLIRMITSGDPPTTLNLASSSGQINWDSQTWQAVGLKIEGQVSQDTFSFSMPNEAGQILSLAASGEPISPLKRAVVDIYIMYPGASDAKQFMQGFVANVSGLMSNRATFVVDRYADENVVVPGLLIAPPLWNKLPPIDLTLEWGGKVIELGE